MRLSFRLVQAGAGGSANEWFEKPMIELYRWCAIIASEQQNEKSK